MSLIGYGGSVEDAHMQEVKRVKQLEKDYADALALLTTGAEPRCPKCGCHVGVSDSENPYYADGSGAKGVHEYAMWCKGYECEMFCKPLDFMDCQRAGLQHALRERQGEAKG